MPLQVAAPAQANAEGNGNAGQKKQAAPRIPFIRASRKVWELGFDETETPAAASRALGPFDVPSRGYLRDVLILVEGSGGVLGDGALTADAPWAYLDGLSLQTPSGGHLIVPLSGYQLFLANAFGAYRGFPDPTATPIFVGDAVTPTFALRLPVEITPWDGYGALANMSASTAYRAHVGLAPVADAQDLGTTGVAPELHVRGFLEAWDEVPATNLAGEAQEVAPPGHSTTQFWTVSTHNVNAGRQVVPIKRVGNFIRTLMLVHRTAAGVRDEAMIPDDFDITLDGRSIIQDKPRVIERLETFEAYGYDRPDGVQVFTFGDDQDGTAGHESRHLWLPTLESSRLEVVGSWDGAGTVEILVNDVKVVGGR